MSPFLVMFRTFLHEEHSYRNGTLKGHLGTQGTRALEGQIGIRAFRHSGTRGTLFNRFSFSLAVLIKFV